MIGEMNRQTKTSWHAQGELSESGNIGMRRLRRTVDSTHWAIKTCRFIFHYISSISWCFFLHFFVPVETEMNTLQNRLRQWCLQFGMTVAGGFLHCVRSNWLCATFAESLPLFLFTIFLLVFLDESSRRKSFRFPQVFIKILSSVLNVFPLFHFIASLLRTK